MAFTFVQKNVNGVTANGGASTTVAVTQTGTAGNLGFGFVTAVDATQTCTVKDSNGVSATMLPSSSGLLDGGNGNRAWMYYFDGITGSPTSVTATYSLSCTTRGITYQEWSGQASPSFDQSNLSNVASSTTPTGTAVTPGVNGELIFAGVVPDSGNATTISIGNNVAWAIRNNPDGNGPSDESFVQAVAASITGKFGFASAQASQLGIMTFKPATVAAHGGTLPLMGVGRRSEPKIFVMPRRCLIKPQRRLLLPRRELLKAA